MGEWIFTSKVNLFQLSWLLLVPVATDDSAYRAKLRRDGARISEDAFWLFWRLDRLRRDDFDLLIVQISYSLRHRRQSQRWSQDGRPRPVHQSDRSDITDIAVAGQSPWIVYLVKKVCAEQIAVIRGRHDSAWSQHGSYDCRIVIGSSQITRCIRIAERGRIANRSAWLGYIETISERVAVIRLSIHSFRLHL